MKPAKRYQRQTNSWIIAEEGNISTVHFNFKGDVRQGLRAAGSHQKQWAFPRRSMVVMNYEAWIREETSLSGVVYTWSSVHQYRYIIMILKES